MAGKSADAEPFGFTIYKNPSDCPGHYVMRAWAVEDGKTVFLSVSVATPISDKALDVLRLSMVERGCVCVGRQPDDDPVIVETWI